MIPSLRNLVLLMLLLNGATLFAQETTDLKGKVVDNATGTGIPFATIFFNNTSIGTIADSLGNYELKNVPIQYKELVASSIGYQSSLTQVSLLPGQILIAEIRLKVLKNILNEVTVTATRDYAWQSRYERFVKILMGTGNNSSFCSIENRGVIIFSETMDGRVLASAGRPLEIFNQSLGYKISLTLLQFEMTSSGFATKFYAHFTELIPKNSTEKIRWQMNRLRTYKGSQRHFLTSLINKKLEEEGFMVFHSQENVQFTDEATRKSLSVVNAEILNPKPVDDPALKGYFKILRKGTYEIHYLNKMIPRPERWYPDFPYPVSWLTLDTEFLLCPPNGIVRSNSNDLVSGDMDRYRVADLLPQDFDPVREEGQVHLSQIRNTGWVTGTVTDSSSGKAIPGAQVFVDKSFYKMTTKDDGRFELRNIPVGIYNLVTGAGSQVGTERIEVKAGVMVHAQIKLPDKKTPEKQLNKDEFTNAKKLTYFKRNFVRGSSSSVKVLNPEVLNIKIDKKRIEMSTSGALEIDDLRTGYKMHYYLKAGEFIGGREQRVVAFTSFDTLKPKNDDEKRKWLEGREEYYRGSVYHWVRSFAEGRANEERFSTTGGKFLYGVNNLQKIILTGNIEIRFEDSLPSTISGDTLDVSPAGNFFTESWLRIKGPMEREILPALPLEYTPMEQTISDPRVWSYIRANQ